MIKIAQKLKDIEKAHLPIGEEKDRFHADELEEWLVRLKSILGGLVK